MRVIKNDITICSFKDAVNYCIENGKNNKSSYACFCNSHMLVESYQDPQFNEIVNSADFVFADGVPLVYSLQLLYGKKQERVAGNDMFPAVLDNANRHKLNVFFYGNTDEVLNAVCERVKIENPDINIVGKISPPFRKISSKERNEICSEINNSKAQIVFVSLGCPKQEKWMAEMKGKVNSMMLGVGGAFNLYAGKDTRAPKWMRDMALEWVYRLILEPKRLFRRYLITNSFFLVLIIKHFCKVKLFKRAI